MSWQTQLRGDSVSWLLESDSPGVRYLALRDLLNLPADDSALKSAAEEGAQGRANCRNSLQYGEDGILGKSWPWIQPKIQIYGLVNYPAGPTWRVSQ